MDESSKHVLNPGANGSQRTAALVFRRCLGRKQKSACFILDASEFTMVFGPRGTYRGNTPYPVEDM